MNFLKLPKSGQISVIIHVSDIHIKLGDAEKSHYSTYEKVFQNLGQILSQIRKVINHTAICLYTGDFFHYKNRLDSLSVRLFNLFITILTQQQIPLYIIQGNHDFVQLDASIPDVISSLLYGHQNPYVNYLGQSGHYIAGQVGFGYVSVRVP